MQFKYPEIFWALLLLLIPIIVHLIQLRKFRKTPFTNVRLLQKVTAQSSKTRSLKRWLLLFSRLLLLAMLIFAFSGPYLANTKVQKAKETLIYLDNSFSMQARATDRSLLENAIQDLVKQIPESYEFTLFTNDRVFNKTRLKDIQNELLTLSPTHRQLRYEDVLVKSKSLLENTEEQTGELIIVSDLQSRFLNEVNPDQAEGLSTRIVALNPGELSNVVLDTVFIANSTPEQIELSVVLSISNSDIESVPVSLFDGSKLIAKSAALFEGKTESQVQFTLSAGVVNEGRVEITDSGLPYDNVLYFSITPPSKTKVMRIGLSDNDYLPRIYTEDEFQYITNRLDQVNYSELASQNLIVLDELNTINRALENAIAEFAENGGSVVIIPGEDIDYITYNSLLASLDLPLLDSLVAGDLNITEIAFDHPLYKDVFENRISNFSYPKSSKSYLLKQSVPYILGYQNQNPFLLGESGRYLFTAPLSAANSTFRNTPLIVPTFYTMGWNSLKIPQLYEALSGLTLTDIPWVAGGDDIVKLKKGDYEFIPLQKRYANKTSLTFTDEPESDGNYLVQLGEQTLTHLSFNYPRKESELKYTDPSMMDLEVLGSIPELLDVLEKEGRITELWKWFVIFAMFFALAEVLVQKLVK